MPPASRAGGRRASRLRPKASRPTPAAAGARPGLAKSGCISPSHQIGKLLGLLLNKDHLESALPQVRKARRI